MNHQDLTFDNSLVAVLDKKNKYMPLQDEHFLSFKANLLYFLIYSLCWLFMVYLTFQRQHLVKYAMGFAFGIVLLLVNIFTYNATKWIYLNNVDLEAYSASFPDVDDKSGEIRQDVGDYKIMLENSAIPQSDQDVYLLPASKYVDYVKQGEIKGENLGDYLEGQFRKDYGYADQERPLFSAQVEVGLSNAAFFIVIICTTWALYTSQSKSVSNERLSWIIAATGLGVLTGGVMFNATTIKERVAFLYIIRRLLILTISFAITAVLI